ncbi:hypothetical protein DICVIV_00250 [Dictyocaulus viviparus]|uniref:Uncharacterized protein n=1 Tax=Dictyocaulus viviparus TaxID=29172 RepID=A0A0D8YBC4_DICVI|nr:hypothetical protein DICVIV_00250 [Dictyocaulus viviparus]
MCQPVVYPCIESPHVMDLHEQPVTCIAYYSNCPSDLICALTLVGCKQRRKGFSEREGNVQQVIRNLLLLGNLISGINFGLLIYQLFNIRLTLQIYYARLSSLLNFRHKDGSLRFWQASGESLQILYRLKTASHFERLEESEWSEKASQAVKLIELCVESRLLLVSGISGQMTLFRFTKTESVNTIAVVHIPQLNTSFGNGNDDRTEPSPIPKAIRRQKVVSRESTRSPDTSDASGDERIVPFKVRGSAIRRSAGYQPELACLVPWPSPFQADSVTSIALNSAFGVIAIGMQMD